MKVRPANRLPGGFRAKEKKMNTMKDQHNHPVLVACRNGMQACHVCPAHDCCDNTAPKLRMYNVNSNLSGHHVVAASPEDALAVLDGLNLDLGDAESFDRSDIVEVPGDTLIGVHTDTEAGYQKKTAAEWIASEGRGLVCSQDY